MISDQSLLIILVIGLIAGWLAGHLVRGTGYGLIADLCLGIVGALIGDKTVTGAAHEMAGQPSCDQTNDENNEKTLIRYHGAPLACMPKRADREGSRFRDIKARGYSRPSFLIFGRKGFAAATITFDGAGAGVLSRKVASSIWSSPPSRGARPTYSTRTRAVPWR